MAWLLLPAILMSAGWTHPEPALKNGIWKAELRRVQGPGIVFNFETKDSAGKKFLYVINGGERLLVDSISGKGDSVFIYMPFFDSHFRARVNPQGHLEVVWIKRAGDKEQVMPFYARHNMRQRFAAAGRPRYNITGRWAVRYGVPEQGGSGAAHGLLVPQLHG